MEKTKSITINQTAVTIKEYNGQRVVTLKDIDNCHSRPDGTARKRFNDNKQHFIDGVDFYKVKCSEVRPFFGQTLPNGFNPNADITLITESGYLMLVKSFTDDLAWQVQRQLVNSYFRVKENYPVKKTADTETAKTRANAMMLNAKYRMANQMIKLWTSAGVEPQYQAIALNGYYDGLEIPRIAFKETAVALFDLTTIAQHLGVQSKSGKPLAQAVGAIIEKLQPLNADEWTKTPYSRNGHDGESIQYTQSVEDKVKNWLVENQYPTTISNQSKNFTVKYLS